MLTICGFSYVFVKNYPIRISDYYFEVDYISG